MPVFKELLETKYMEDPGERKAQDLERSNKTASKKTKVNETSVTQGTYMTTMRVILALGFIALALFATFLIYLGVTSFIPK